MKNQKLQPLREMVNHVHPLKPLLVAHQVQYWQVLQRLGSLGLTMQAPQLSRILNGKEKPKLEVEEALDYIRKELLKIEN